MKLLSFQNSFISIMYLSIPFSALVNDNVLIRGFFVFLRRDHFECVRSGRPRTGLTEARTPVSRPNFRWARSDASKPQRCTHSQVTFSTIRRFTRPPESPPACRAGL